MIYQVIVMLFVVLIIVNVGALISIAMLLHYERKVNMSFRSWIFQYSKDMQMLETLKEHASKQDNFIIIRVFGIEDCYNEISDWIDE